MRACRLFITCLLFGASAALADVSPPRRQPRAAAQWSVRTSEAGTRPADVVETWGQVEGNVCSVFSLPPCARSSRMQPSSRAHP
jgi:hypothetical protein